MIWKFQIETTSDDRDLSLSEFLFTFLNRSKFNNRSVSMIAAHKLWIKIKLSAWIEQLALSQLNFDMMLFIWIRESQHGLSVRWTTSNESNNLTGSKPNNIWTRLNALFGINFPMGRTASLQNSLKVGKRGKLYTVYDLILSNGL